MRNAIKQIDPRLIKYVNAHATSTPLGDVIEAKAISKVFSHGPKVSSSKGQIGHLLGAAGSVEAIITIMSLHEGIVIPTANLTPSNLDMENLPLDFVMGSEIEREPYEYALSNSFGFYGTNASILFNKRG